MQLGTIPQKSRSYKLGVLSSAPLSDLAIDVAKIGSHGKLLPYLVIVI